MFFRYRLNQVRKAYQTLEPLETVDLISSEVRRIAIHHSGSVERISQLFRFLLDQNPNVAITVLTRDEEMNRAIRKSETYQTYQKLHAIQIYPYTELSPNESFNVSLVVLGEGEREFTLDPVLRELFLAQRFSGTDQRFLLTDDGYFFDSHYNERLNRGKARWNLKTFGPGVLERLKSKWDPEEYSDFRFDEETQRVVYHSSVTSFRLPSEASLNNQSGSPQKTEGLDLDYSESDR